MDGPLFALGIHIHVTLFFNRIWSMELTRTSTGISSTLFTIGREPFLPM